LYLGILLVRVLAPQTLRRALLPYRTKDGRLTFPLCAKCADEMRQLEPCPHQALLERSWVSGFTHIELNRALQLGYTVIEGYEVWNYKNWARPGGQGIEAPLFEDYINMFLKMKACLTIFK